jgi:nucleoside-diphosphate-sugar epimerase
VKVLVTGGAGYVGSVACALLLDRGNEVRAFDSLTFGGDALLSLFQRDGFEFVRGDIRLEEDVDRAIEHMDAVVHLAAVVGDPACRRDPELARAVNLDASLRLFELARSAGVERFVFASTCSNYGRMADPTTYVDETAELRPLSVYAETKVAVENALLADPFEMLPAATVLRFATVYGLSPRPRFDLTVNEFAAELLLKRHLVVYGEQFWRPYVHVRDAARAIALTLEQPLHAVSGLVLNVGATDQNFRKQDLVELVCEQVDSDVEVERVHRDEDPRDYRVSFERIRNALGFEPTRTVPDGIREVIGVLRQGVITTVDDARYRN